MFKLMHNYTHRTHWQSNTQIFQVRLQQYINHEISDVQAGFRKDRESTDQIANICGIIEKAREFQKNICYKLENSSRDGNTRPLDLPLEKPVCRSGRNSSNWTWNNRLVLNRKRNMPRLYIVPLLI